MLRITSGKDGATFTVKVVPRASRNEIAASREGVLRIRLTAPPVGGAANKALVKFLAGVLGVPKRDIEIVAGHTGRQKVIQVRGLSPEQVRAGFEAHLPPG